MFRSWKTFFGKAVRSYRDRGSVICRYIQPSSRFTRPTTKEAASDVSFSRLSAEIAANLPFNAFQTRVTENRALFLESGNGVGVGKGRESLVRESFPEERGERVKEAASSRTPFPAAIVRGIRVIKPLLLGSQPLPETRARNGKKKCQVWVRRARGFTELATSYLF